MVAVLWQSTLLACAVAVTLLVWHGLSPTVRCWVWRIVAIKLLVMPFWTVDLPLPSWLAVASPPVRDVATDSGASGPMPQASAVASPERAATQETMQVASTTVRPPPQLTWQAWLMAMWLVVIGAQVVRLGWQQMQLRRLLGMARPAAAGIRRLVDESCEQLRLVHKPEVCVTDVEVSPFVCRVHRPLLVLPASIANADVETQLRQIVLHELRTRGGTIWPGAGLRT